MADLSYGLDEIILKEGHGKFIVYTMSKEGNILCPNPKWLILNPNSDSPGIPLKEGDKLMFAVNGNCDEHPQILNLIRERVYESLYHQEMHLGRFDRSSEKFLLGGGWINYTDGRTLELSGSSMTAGCVPKEVAERFVPLLTEFFKEKYHPLENVVLNLKDDRFLKYWEAFGVKIPEEKIMKKRYEEGY